MGTKNVMLIVPNLAQGGQERVCLMTEDLLGRNGEFQVCTVIFDDQNLFYDTRGHNIIHICLPAQKGIIKKLLQLLRRTMAVKKLKKSRCIDYAYSFGATANMVNVFSRRTEKVFTGVRGYLELKSWTQRKFVYPRADVTVCCSKSMADDAKRMYGLEHTVALTNPVDIETVRKKAAAQAVSLMQKKTAAKEKIIITLGRIHEVKGYGHLVRAFAYMNRRYKNARLIHIGGGDPQPYIRLARQLGVEERVDFLGGKTNPFPYLAGADLYVLSSVSEGFPNAMVEAMAAGLPVVATDCKSGPREILHEDIYDPVFERKEIVYADYGILVPVMDGKADWQTDALKPEEKCLADAMLRILSDEKLAEGYRKKSMERVRRYSLEEYEKAVCRLFV